MNVYQIPTGPNPSPYNSNGLRPVNIPLYTGCYADTATSIFSQYMDMTGYLGWNTLMYCTIQAINYYATYFGLQNGYGCYFGNNTLSQLGTLRPDSECTAICTGNQNTTAVIGPSCGGYLRNSVYKTPSVAFNHY